MKKKLVLDASVAIKWIFPDDKNEEFSFQAQQVLHSIKRASVHIFQPVHWLAEVGAVITRKNPLLAETTLNLLHAMEFPIVNDLEVYQTGCRLAEKLNHHLFDTLYHAVAIYKDALFITADKQYQRKAAKYGSILYLSDFDSFVE